MQKRSRTKQKEGPVEANLIPVLSCMFLLIPALLLAMEVANWGSVTVTPPRHSVDADPGQPTDNERLRFSVMVRSDGFLAKVGARGSSDEAATEIPLHATDHDYGALETLAANLKAQHPNWPQVSLSAEGDIPLSTLVKTMDALRGHECSLSAAYAQEADSDQCLFWEVVVES